MTPSLELQQHLDALQSTIGEGNAKRGFHDEGDRLRESVEYGSAHHSDLRNYYMTKLALIHSEATEAVEELRNGRAVDHTYHSEGGKPEGVPSEIADVVIRCFDFADEAGFSLGEIILEKLRFNATRGRMHGGKQV